MTTNYHSPLATGASGTSANINTRLSDLDSGVTGILAGTEEFLKLRFEVAASLTISSGAVTASRSNHKIDTQGAAASDDLDTINGGVDGYMLAIRAANTARTVVVKHGTGNIYLNNAADFSLDNTEKTVLLIFNGTYWIGIGLSGGGSVDASGVTYTPGTLGDWNSSTDPGGADDALNQLAARVKTLEGAGGSVGDYIHIEDQKTSGTNGGTFTAGAWQTRDLNTEVSDAGGHASVASNQITLAAGTYRVRAHAYAGGVNAHRLRLQNITDGTTLLLGSDHLSTSTANSSNHAMLEGEFTIASTKVIELQHRCQTTGTTNGLGYASGWGTEVYSVVTMVKVA